jgi:hypothetical protein
MTKRSSPPSPVQEHLESKKQKTEDDAGVSSVYHSQYDSAADHHDPDIAVHGTKHDSSHRSAQNRILEVQGNASHGNLETGADNTNTGEKKKKTKQKAGQGFRDWIPKPAFAPIPPLQPHWGIVPRPGGHRHSLPQPSARDSYAAVRPALWEDRKGSVRIKRGSRFVDRYDQAYHMWLPLMDLRPVSFKSQAPRRKAIGYYYKHGMPSDWNDADALTDLNKALQNAIKANSNETQWTSAERSGLASLCAAHPQASIWDIAERFNNQIYPILDTEEVQYHKGRFTESIRNEYLTY